MRCWVTLLFTMFLLWVGRVEAQDDVLVVINGKNIKCIEYEDFCARRGMSPALSIDTFISCKLRVDAARCLGLDTLETIRSYLDSYRHHLLYHFLVERKNSLVSSISPENNVASDCVLVHHIFRYIPQNVTTYQWRTYKTLMDSICLAITNGELSFEKAVQEYSEEKEPFWVGPLEMPVEFEQVVSTLPVGQVSDVFLTPQGIHIAKVLQRKSCLKDEFIRSSFRDRKYTMKFLLDSLKHQYRFLPDESGIRDFLAHGVTSRNLFSLDGQIYSGKYMELFKQSRQSSLKNLLDDFITKSVWACAGRYLEENCPEYSLRLRAYSDSLLCRTITNDILGEKLRNDTLGVAIYFQRNKKNYRWSEIRFDGIVLHCVSKRVGKKVKKFLKGIPSDEWQDAIRLGVNADNLLVMQVEQGVFALGDNKYVDDVIFKKGEAEQIKGFPYTLVLGKKKNGPEYWMEVGDKLWDDYRNYREACWLKDLRENAKVEIKQNVLKTIKSR